MRNRAQLPASVRTGPPSRSIPLALVHAFVFALLVAVPSHGHSMKPPASNGGTLRFVQEQVTSLDPMEIEDAYSAVVSMQIHRGLLRYNTNLTPVPDLARSWTISRDGLHYTLQLNEGVRFHNGRELTAQDCVYTFERIFSPGGTPGLPGQFLAVIDGAEDYHTGRTEHISGLSAADRYTLDIRLSYPNAAFLWALAMNQAAIVPREVVEEIGDEEFGRRPIGCGPFRLVSNEPYEVRLAANPDYYRERAHLDSLVFISMEGQTIDAGAAALLNGACDLAELPGFRREEVAGTQGLRLISRRELTLSFVGMNLTIPPFDNPAVRKALAMSVDRAGAIALNPSGQIAATGILPPGVACYSPEVRVYPFDIDAARGVLADAGFPGGVGIEEIPYYTTRSTGRAGLVDSMMIADWRKVGLPVRMVETDWIRLQEMMDDYELGLFSLSWIADIPDPDSFLGSLFDSQSPLNYFRYANSEVDSLLTIGRATVDIRARRRIYGRIEDLIIREAPFVPLYTTTAAYGVRRDIHGLELTPLGISSVDLARVWRDKNDHASRRSP